MAINAFSAAPIAPFGSSTSSPHPDSEASAPIAPNHDKLLKAFLFITFASKMYRTPIETVGRPVRGSARIIRPASEMKISQ
ncbi:hypothetical protein X946_5345 [Burkholderia sp. ABCPW 111]|nr:hypothetical protein X946_5345 [Burkholderia sp. ABCPW 111]